MDVNFFTATHIVRIPAGPSYYATRLTYTTGKVEFYGMDMARQQGDTIPQPIGVFAVGNFIVETLPQDKTLEIK